MAEEGKRRRSRPSNWWEVQDDDTENGVEGSSRITAQSKSQSLNTNSNIPGGGNTKRKAKPWVPVGMGAPIEKRRGRPSFNLGSTTAKQKGRNDDGEGNIEAEAEDEGLRKQQQSRDEIEPRRGRKNANNKRGIMSVNSDTDVIETVTATSSLAPQKKRGRPPVRVVNHGVRDEQERNAAAGSRKKGEAKAQDTEVGERRRGRPALGNMGTTNNQKKKIGDRIEPENDESSRSQKRRQAEPESSAPGRTMKKASKDNEESPEKHAKPKKHVRISDVSQNIEPESAQSKPKNSVPLESSKSTRKRKDSNSDDQQPQQQTKRRRMEDSQDNRADAEQPEPLSYRHLAAVTRRVSLETINTKWEALPPGCLDKISELLIDVQRPVVLQIHDERKKTQASTAIQMISRRLLNRVRKGMPFPKGTRTNREDDFDFEKILDYNRALESQLTPVLHSNDLLEAELRKEEILLENEGKYLAELEANAKDEAISRRQAARKAHPLLQFEVDSTGKVLNDNMGIGDAAAPLITLNTSKYQDLEGIFKNINGHVDSIKGNLQQVEGITEAMAKSKASVQAALFAHLDLEQYNDVVLG
ncbi:hypothetical protein OCU04_009193 [Sclerotinia nivalis]|uniref:Kinetochore protein fta7 n=1 Tax=Sclerotinia nivalis TaxID=352851 RepID=A0A9X0DGI0_9HELO|nr:hypothetical protein OCU04_009193 [Sclerotinia nivalis]